MTKHLEHAGLGVSFDLPDIRQRDAEALLEAERSIRRKREANRQEAIDVAAEDIRLAILAAQRGQLRASSPELAALALRAAEGIVRRMATTPLDDLSDQEVAGVWVRAAMRLGWLLHTEALGEIAEEAVGDMKPSEVRWVVHQILSAINEATAIPNV